MAGHYIKLYRSLLEWEWYHDANVTRLFLHLLLRANWKPGRFEGVDILRGQYPTSFSKLAIETGLSIQNVRTSLNRLKSTGEVTSKSQGKFTVVTVNNYDKYQDANTDANRGLTGSQQASNTHLTTIEEEQEDNNKPTTATDARESQLKRLCQFYEANNFGMIAPYVAQEMRIWLDEGTSAELVERCLKEAVACGSSNWKYTARILERCRAQKIETISQFEADRRKREAEREKQPLKVAAGGASTNPFLREDI